MLDGEVPLHLSIFSSGEGTQWGSGEESHKVRKFSECSHSPSFATPLLRLQLISNISTHKGLILPPSLTGIFILEPKEHKFSSKEFIF